MDASANVVVRQGVGAKRLYWLTGLCGVFNLATPDSLVRRVLNLKHLRMGFCSETLDISVRNHIRELSQ